MAIQRKQSFAFQPMNITPLHYSLAAAIAMLSILSPLSASAAPFPALNIKAVDPLEKIFRDAPAIETSGSLMEAARGEHASFQLVVTSCPVDLKSVRCEVTSFTLANSDFALAAEIPRFVGYVGSSITATQSTPTRQLRSAPAMYPDPLLPIGSQDVLAGQNQPVWITVPVSADARPGDYHATATITARMFGTDTSATLPLTLKVYPATISNTRLNVTLWYQLWNHDDWKMPERYSDAWFDVLGGYIKSMAAHRLNWGWVETQDAMLFTSGDDGELRIDFTNFDRWMDALFAGGMKMVEGQHFAFRTNGWKGPFGVQVYEEDGGKWRPSKMPPDSTQAEDFYAIYFPALQAHLEEKGWIDKYVQHVADEPLDSNADSYTTAAGLLKKYAPGIRIMEACQTEKIAGTVDIWIPQLDHFAKDYDFLLKRQKAGDEIWFYTCMYPQGDYPNRFLEQPLIETRLLHWMNYRYGATGYLHWGWNFWPPHPWENAADFRMMQLPGGDAQIVYPEPGGPGVWDSIRYEAMRDGIEDHELLSQLGDHDPAVAMALAKQMIHGFQDVDTNIKIFRQVRHELLDQVSRLH